MSESTHTTGPLSTATNYYDDRIRWPAVVAGLFGTLAMLAVLTVLGVAIGLSAADRHSDASNFALGAGIWGTIAALLSFAFGGWLAVRSAGSLIRGNGMLQSAMVWMVSLALLTYLLGSGLSSLTRSTVQGTASNPDITSRVMDNSPTASGTGTTVTGNTNSGDTTGNTAGQTVTNATSTDRAAAAERTADRAAKGAWGTLIAMVLGLVASLAGGYLASRKNVHEDDRRDSTYAGRPATAV